MRLDRREFVQGLADAFALAFAAPAEKIAEVLSAEITAQKIPLSVRISRRPDKDFYYQLYVSAICAPEYRRFGIAMLVDSRDDLDAASAVLLRSFERAMKHNGRHVVSA